MSPPRKRGVAKGISSRGRRVKEEPVAVRDPADAPRSTFGFAGNPDALQRVARAIRSGRPPQAWLFGGPPGVGKATLAFRAARYLLAFGATDRGPETLAVPPGDAASLQVRAGSHPGLLVLRRAIHPDTGKPMTVLSVGEARKLGNFFSLTSGGGGWRVAIIDTADDMNDAASNAILKILEEPPRRALLILLANSPARLLPTIRSRCQRLTLKPLTDAEVDSELQQHLPNLSPSERTSMVKLANGSIGFAMELANGEGIALAAEAERLVEAATSPDFAATLALADKIARIDGGIEDFGRHLTTSLCDRVRIRARSGQGDLRRWVELWETLEANQRRGNALHLEPRQAVLSAAHAFSETARRGTL